MPRLLVYKFTLIYAIQVFLRSNPNASRNRSLLFPGSGLLSLRPHIVLAPLTNGSRLCMMTYIQYCQRLLSVSQYASLLVLAGKVVSFTNCVGNISRFMTKSLFFLPRHEFVCSLLGSLSNHDDYGNKNLTNLHI